MSGKFPFKVIFNKKNKCGNINRVSK